MIVQLFVALIAVMSEQSRQYSVHSQASSLRHHIASLTHSQMIMLNLKQLQSLASFTCDLVLTEDQDERQLVAFEEEEPHNYLLMVPVAFFMSTKNHCRAFVELLCLCSQTITLPLAGHYYDQLTSLLASYCLNYRYKKGKNVVKLYLATECSLTYLDFVTFQAVQFKEKNCKELLAMKKSNAYQFCLSHFREDLLPALFTTEEQSIETLLQNELVKLRLLHRDLIAEERFTLLYELMNETGSTFKQLEKEVEALLLARHVTTVGDEECEGLIGQQLEGIIEAEIQRHREELSSREGETQFIYVKIVYQLLQKLRDNGFEVNDDKYLFLTSKVLQDMHSLQKQKDNELRRNNIELARTVQLQQQQISQLQQQMQSLKQQLQASRRKRDLSIVVEEKEDTVMSMKRSTSEVQLQKEPITIKDLKEPLQLLTLNTPNTPTIHSKPPPLLKTAEKKGRAVAKKRQS